MAEYTRGLSGETGLVGRSIQYVGFQARSNDFVSEFQYEQ